MEILFIKDTTETAGAIKNERNATKFFTETSK